MSESAVTARGAHLHGILQSMGSLSRMFASRGAYPFRDRALGRRQMDLLFFVSQSDGMPVGALAEALHVTSGAVSQALELLKDADLITVTVNPADRRRRIVRMTQDAAREVAAFQDGYVAAVAHRFDSLAGHELEELDRLLQKIGN